MFRARQPGRSRTFHSGGCPVQAPLGRGCSLSVVSHEIPGTISRCHPEEVRAFAKRSPANEEPAPSLSRGSLQSECSLKFGVGKGTTSVVPQKPAFRFRPRRERDAHPQNDRLANAQLPMLDDFGGWAILTSRF